MRYLKISIILILLTFIFSCKKDKNLNTSCFPNTSTVRQISNAPATIKDVGGKFYIVEKGSIDSKLNPCPLEKEFQINNLQVTISGEVKSTTQGDSGPCCTENFIITQISR